MLETGWHEKRKDAYDEHYLCWKYAIRSDKKDERALRVIVTFDSDEPDFLIVTLIDLDKDDD